MNTKRSKKAWEIDATPLGLMYHALMAIGCVDAMILGGDKRALERAKEIARVEALAAEERARELQRVF